ncbi:transcription factor HES-2 [Bufo gargarizans]|uniref:transcription factor HES-2 n=1 Tax=Bufo bufo TaxID=8384 RepID=UPI001ABDCE50|nr:transcription factor HES-2 [Bufo bufo]XP_044134300.1 transcription factor HES-2 [Bufo gargarizans]
MAPSMIVTESASSYQPKPGKKSKEASELRKTLKPLMEKRRRARINESLNQLKALILPLIGKDNSRYSKLEKADILEMTVRFLKDIPPVQTQSSTEKYREGYRACLERLSGLLSNSHAIAGETCTRLLDHLQKSPELCCQDCTKSPSAKVNSSTPRIVLHLNPRRSEILCSSPNQVPSRPQAPSTPQPTSSIWRPW